MEPKFSNQGGLKGQHGYDNGCNVRASRDQGGYFMGHQKERWVWNMLTGIKDKKTLNN